MISTSVINKRPECVFQMTELMLTWKCDDNDHCEIFKLGFCLVLFGFFEVQEEFLLTQQRILKTWQKKKMISKLLEGFRKSNYFFLEISLAATALNN